MTSAVPSTQRASLKKQIGLVNATSYVTGGVIDMAPTTAKIMLGFVVMGHDGHFQMPFRTKDLQPGGLALAVYAGFYAYGGCSAVALEGIYPSGKYSLSLSGGIEEVLHPHRNIPLAISIGLLIPSLLYTLVNIAYHAVLTNDESLSGVAVAVVFGERKLGISKWSILPCVAASAAGAANTSVFAASRQNFVGGRDGLLSRFLGMVNVRRRTPQPSILALFVGACIVMCLGDVKSILGAYAFFWASGEFIGVCGIWRIRQKYPSTDNTYKVHWICPVIFITSFSILSITAISSTPGTYLVPFIITLLGVPVFYASKSDWWKRSCFMRINGEIRNNS